MIIIHNTGSLITVIVIFSAKEPPLAVASHELVVFNKLIIDTRIKCYTTDVRLVSKRLFSEDRIK